MNISYIIPESKADISIEIYKSVSAMYKQAEENETIVSDAEKVCAYLGLDRSVIDQLSSADYDLAVDNIIRIEGENTTEHYLTFDLQGVRYGFITDIDSITIGERAAIEKMLVDIPKYACELMNVFYRPIVKEKTYKSWFTKNEKKRYLIEKYNSKRKTDQFLKAPCSVLDGAVVFFWSLGRDLISSTLKYTKEELQMGEVKHLVKNGDGIKHLIHTLQQSEYEWKRYRTNLNIKYSFD